MTVCSFERNEDAAACVAALAGAAYMRVNFAQVSLQLEHGGSPLINGRISGGGRSRSTRTSTRTTCTSVVSP